MSAEVQIENIIEELMKRHNEKFGAIEKQRLVVHDMVIFNNLVRLYTLNLRSGYLRFPVRQTYLSTIERIMTILNSGKLAVVEIEKFVNTVVRITVIEERELPIEKLWYAQVRIRNGLRIEYFGMLYRVNENTVNAMRLKEAYDRGELDGEIAVLPHPIDEERRYIEALQWVPIKRDFGENESEIISGEIKGG